jgi:flagellar motor protein MotB
VCSSHDAGPDPSICANCAADLSPLNRIGQLDERFLAEGLRQASQGRLRTAARHFEGALAIRRTNGPAAIALGKARWLLGERDAAIAAWSEIESTQPEFQDAQELLRETPVKARRSRRRSTLLWRLAGAVVLLALTGMAASRWMERTESFSVVTPISDNRVTPIAAAQATDLQSARLNRLADQLAALDGVAVERRERSITVSFLNGLFARGGTKIGAPAYRILEALAADLGRSTHDMRIIVEGLTDTVPLRPGGRWRDNWTLALARAQTVADQLRRDTRSRTQWLLTADGEPAAFPSTARRPNRSVLVHIEWR